MDYETQNYPSEHDSKLAGASLLLRCQYLFLGTSEGGYGSPKNLWSPIAQRGHLEHAEDNQKGLLDQSVNSGPIGDEIPDTKQGLDSASREHFTIEILLPLIPRRIWILTTEIRIARKKPARC